MTYLQEMVKQLDEIPEGEYRVIILVPSGNGYRRNISGDKAHAIIFNSSGFTGSGSFVPDFFGGNPYSCYLKFVKDFIKFCDFSIDNVTMLVYSLASGTAEYHNSFDMS